MISLLSIAYTSIPPQRASIYLGVVDDDQSVVQELVNVHHWNYDQSTNLLLPKKNDEEQMMNGNRGGGVGGIAKLAGMVGRLSDL